MAGISWIKIEVTLPTKPVVMHVKRAVKCSVNEAIGLIVRVLTWADGLTADGVCEGYILEDIDEHFDALGLAAGLLLAGWIYVNEDGWVAFDNWENHNGEGAKKRAMDARRSGKYRTRKNARSQDGVTGSCDERHANVTQKCDERHAKYANFVTVERDEMRDLDKIREEYITPQTPQGAIEVNYDSPENFVTHGGGEVKPPEQAADDTPLPYPEHFEAFWKDYPKRTGMNGAYAKAKIQRLWRKAIENGYTGDDILRALDTAMQDKMWVDSNYQKAPRIVNWFENEVMYSFLPRNRKAAVKRVQQPSRPSDEEDYPELSADDLNSHCE